MPDLTPPSGMGSQPQQSGPAPISPAPAQANPTATEMVTLVHGIVQNARAIAMKVPSAAPIVRKINDLVQELQRAIVSNQAPSQPAAPPV